MIWLALISYPLEKWIEQAGCILDLSDSIMGVTFLAFATTSSDCLSSVFVGRNGLGTMAVCNALVTSPSNLLRESYAPFVAFLLTNKTKMTG